MKRFAITDETPGLPFRQSFFIAFILLCDTWPKGPERVDTMLLRPVDTSGDILPVLSTSALLTGPDAVARLVYGRLSLLAGEWWENPDKGFRILEALRSSRLTEADASMLSSQVTEYIRETPGVLDVEDVEFSVSGREFRYACTVLSEEGSAVIHYSV